MSVMIGKVSLQEKIAELESRIAALEKQRCVTVKTVTTEETSAVTVKGQVFGEHWNKMWDEFNLTMKSIFK